MGFIKKNAFLLACALAGVLGLAAMVWGFTSMGRVRAEMGKAAKLNNELGRLSKDAVNPSMIDIEEERIRESRAHEAKVLAHFGERNKRELILPEVLPEPPPGPEGKKLQYEFQSRYREKMHELVKLLKGDTPPTGAEVDDMADYLKKKALEATQLPGGVPAPAGPAPRESAGRPATGSAPAVANESTSGLPAKDGPASTRAYWSALEERAKIDPTVLASISKAKQMYCYVNLAPGGSFDLHPIFLDTGDTAPNMSEVWDAQMLYWMQRDVVLALARVNDRAASALEQPWVGNLPIKDVLAIRVSDYIREASTQTAAARSAESSRPPEQSDAVFTYRFSQPQFDVVNIRVTVAVDVRDLPIILDAFCDEHYYVVLNVNYTAVPPDIEFSGKVYGPEPIVIAVIDLQTYLYYKSFVPQMPEVIRRRLGIPDDEFERLIKELQGEGGEADAAEPDGGA